MTDQDLEAIEIAEVIENVISDTVATGAQPENIEAMADLNIGGNENPNNNRIVFRMLCNRLRICDRRMRYRRCGIQTSGFTC